MLAETPRHSTSGRHKDARLRGPAVPPWHASEAAPRRWPPPGVWDVTTNRKACEVVGGALRGGATPSEAPCANSRPEASAHSPSSVDTPRQRRIKLRGAFSLGQPRSIGRHGLAGPASPALISPHRRSGGPAVRHGAPRTLGGQHKCGGHRVLSLPKTNRSHYCKKRSVSRCTHTRARTHSHTHTHARAQLSDR